MAKPQKPKRNKSYNPDKHKMPSQEYDLTKGEFMTLGMLQQTIESAQKAQATFLSNLAGSKWGYKDDVKVGFAINWDEGKVRVDIQREQNENASDTIESQSN